MDKLPSVSEQFGAVIAAPVPFFIAVAVIAWAAWRAWQWRFKAVFEKQRELYDLSRSEVDHWKTNAQQTAKELGEKIALLEKQQNLTEGTKEQLGLARQGLLELTTQLNRLGQANNAVGLWDWSSSGWMRRNSTNATSPSG
jgi:hypothetical protein